MRRIGISTDCMCDLPTAYLEANCIDVMQFYIHTATGRFWSGSEITTENIVEYFETGHVFLRSSVPEPEECRAYFEEILTRYDEVIHITTSDKIGMSHPNAKAALERMGENARRVTLINSGGVSTGLGHMVQLAAALRDSGASVAEIVAACDAMRGKLANSFIVPDAEYLYRVGYMRPGLRKLCGFFRLHPVICTRNGKIIIKALYVGRYEKAVMRYIRSELKRGKKIDKRQLFITHAGCTTKLIAQAQAKVDKLCKFDKVTVTKASAFISSCCGPETVGVLYVYE